MADASIPAGASEAVKEGQRREPRTPKRPKKIVAVLALSAGLLIGAPGLAGERFPTKVGDAVTLTQVNDLVALVGCQHAVYVKKEGDRLPWIDLENLVRCVFARHHSEAGDFMAGLIRLQRAGW